MPAGAGENNLSGELIFPENLPSRQAESGRFRQRVRLACDHRTPLPAGL